MSTAENAPQRTGVIHDIGYRRYDGPRAGLPAIVGSLLWGMAFDGFRPDRFDVVGAALCLVGVGLIMYAPRAA